MTCMTCTTLGGRAVRSRGGGKRIAGFTLIEVLVVFVIIAILIALALPSYQSALRRGNRTDAKAIMMESAQYMERYYSTNKFYTGAAPLSAVSPKGSSGAAIKYNITATTAATTFMLTAAPANGQVGDTCGPLTLSNTGAQTAAIGGCW